MARRFQDMCFHTSPVLTYQKFNKWMLQLLMGFQVICTSEYQSCHKKIMIVVHLRQLDLFLSPGNTWKSSCVDVQEDLTGDQVLEPWFSQKIWPGLKSRMDLFVCQSGKQLNCHRYYFHKQSLGLFLLVSGSLVNNTVQDQDLAAVFCTVFLLWDWTSKIFMLICLISSGFKEI